MQSRKRHVKQRGVTLTPVFKKLDTVYCLDAQKFKDLYADMHTAGKAAMHLMRKRPQDKLRPYHCQRCSGWHLTSNPRKKMPTRQPSGK